MKKILPFVLAALALPAWSDTPASPPSAVLNFENLPNLTNVLDSYAAQGISFSDNAISLRSATLTPDGTGRFYGGAPGSALSAITLFDRNAPPGPTPTPATLRVALSKGFGSSFSVQVAALYGSFVSATAYAADGKTVVGSNSSDTFNGACANDNLCVWTSLNFDITGRAEYLELTADEGAAFFDDMVFGGLPSAGPGNDVPEPSGLLLGVTALGALAWARRLSRR